MTRPHLLILLSLLTSIPTDGQAQSVALPNSSFETGNGAPAGWNPEGSGGRTTWETQGRTGKRSISVTGTKTDEATYWKCTPPKLVPQQVYRFSFWSKAQNPGGGCIISGPSTSNCDFPFSTDWKRYSYVFTAPEQNDYYLRLGQWNATGKVFFDDVALTKLVPQHLQTNSGELGEGERITNGTYHFSAPLMNTNYSRPLVSATAGFNSTRWVMNSDTTVSYEHQVGDYTQKRATVHVNINYYVSGRLVVEASGDGNSWVRVAETSKQGTLEAPLPASLFPAKSVSVRLRSASTASGTRDSSPGSFQINDYGYTAQLEEKAPAIIGRTIFLEEKLVDNELPVNVITLDDLRPGGQKKARLLISNFSTKLVPLQASLNFHPAPGPSAHFSVQTVAIPGKTTVDIPYRLLKAGAFTANLNITAGKQPVYSASAEFSVPSMFAADYGYALSSDKESDLWWAEAPYKISRERPAPTAKRSAVEIQAARHEYEPFQFVVRPRRDIKGVTVSSADLTGPRGTRISRDHISICAVDYVNISQPTDNTGMVGSWPDPLPPLKGPIDLVAGQNQPFWITVYVPEGTTPGLYQGAIKLSARGWQKQVPVRLTVRSFTLPHETHVESAFGLSPDMVRRYHNLETNAELATVMDRYYRNFATHRIAPYDPFINAPIKVDFGGVLWQGGKYDINTPFVGKRSLQVIDDNEKAPATASYGVKLPVEPGKTHTLKYAVRTAKPGQMYQVTLNTHDMNGNWISGNNFDISRQGSGTWEQVTVDVSPYLKPNMRSVVINLRSVPWQEDGSGTGTAWFDEIQFTGPDGKNLVQDGGFENLVQPSQVKVDFREFDKAMEKAMTQYRFTSFRLPIEGMGGGTFHERYLGRIGSFEAGSPEYEALFGSYLRQLQDHLEQKGWLDKAYVYWFDEPDPKDYEFVRAGMDRLKKYAPKLTRMLTEEPQDGLAGAVDLWCPITNNFDPKVASERMRKGEKFWWYVCTGPKAPYVTLFIDHPATELRTWLWQTWQYGIKGILVWESLYWTSSAAYPDALQNPWQDPMSWVSGYSTAAGTKAAWGNGDGRFLYPPNRAPGVDKKKYLEGPINSIRWEMLREGIEDYEYFYLLQQKVQQAKRKGIKSTVVTEAEKLLQVPGAVTTNLTTFAQQPQPILEHREKLARTIESLPK